jgi:glycosyltransferase involved in cell wall biosynthesis
MSSIVLLTNGWGPKHGGINSFNTDLAKALGLLLHPGTRVACTVFEATEDEIHDAERSQVALLPIGRSTDGQLGSKKAEVMAAFRARWSSPVEELWWIGHDVISGELANELAKQFGRSAIIHHMNYLAYQAYKQGTGAEAQKRHDQQKQIFRAANRVLAVGPMLRDSLADMLKREPRKIPTLVPGLAEIQPSPMPTVFSAITFGRLDQPNDRIKQGRLAVAAFADACRQAKDNQALPRALRQARMTLIGIARSGGEEEDSIDALSEKYAAGVHTLVQLPYEDDRDKLFEVLSGSSIAMMLSWHEGFGLTGWEAIAAEVPLIVSRNSGLYQLIEEQLGQAGIACLKGLDIRGHYADEGEENFHPEDVRNVAQAILEIASQPEGAKKSARMLLDLLRRDGEYTWRAAARDLATALEIPLRFQTSAAILDPPPHVPGVPGATEGAATTRTKSRVDTRNFPNYVRLLDSIAARTLSKPWPFTLNRTGYQEMVTALGSIGLPLLPSTFVNHLHHLVESPIPTLTRERDWSYFTESVEWIAVSVEDISRESDTGKSLRSRFEDPSTDGNVIDALWACERCATITWRTEVPDPPGGWPRFIRNILLKSYAVMQRSAPSMIAAYSRRVGELERLCSGGSG